jgi:hypothetical protein
MALQFILKNQSTKANKKQDVQREGFIHLYNMIEK